MLKKQMKFSQPPVLFFVNNDGIVCAAIYGNTREECKSISKGKYPFLYPTYNLEALRATIR